MPVIGHTFSEDMWVPDADNYFEKQKYYSSERWMSEFLIHDDNFGPYLCLPRNYLDDHDVTVYGLNKTREPLCFDKAELIALEQVFNCVSLFQRGRMGVGEKHVTLSAFRKSL